ncbi:YbbR domain-containing protein [Aneurinibacillus soli]|uniref:YbbR-like protein n=1 Tax=Aneurinibacillus soli TaxID=1500254 RepID=A0A0U5B315_9BACL|nr:CdaR family protein [Aneurinibacillus soli]PYE58931.1 YbbR domain-containing protein [Aneurinibacillus soli]BAU26054.1 YbbR-like protein [Aneurinibacillus soli]
MDRWLSNNSFVKVMSLVMAILLWMIVTNSSTSSNGAVVGQPQVTSQVTPVKLEARYDDRKFIVHIPDTVQVELKGNRDILALSSLLSREKFDFYVDLSKYESGRYEVPVQYEGLPPGLDVVVTPSVVTVTIERIKKVQKDVRVAVVGQSSDVVKVGNVVVNPRTVTVTVPESQVKNIGLVQAVVNIEDATETVNSSVPIRVLDRRGQPIESARTSPSSVDVQVPLTIQPSKQVPLQVSFTGKPADGYGVTGLDVRPKEVTVYGTQEVLDHLSSYPVPAVNVDGITESKTVQVPLPLPKGVTRVDSPSVTVVVTVKAGKESIKQEKPPATTPTASEQQVSKSLEIPVYVNGVTDSQTSEIVKPESGRVHFNVIGTKEAIDQVEQSQLSASVDMSNKPPGQYTASVQVNLPSGVSLASDTANLQATVIIRDRASKS